MAGVSHMSAVKTTTSPAFTDKIEELNELTEGAIADLLATGLDVGVIIAVCVGEDDAVVVAVADAVVEAVMDAVGVFVGLVVAVPVFVAELVAVVVGEAARDAVVVTPASLRAPILRVMMGESLPSVKPCNNELEVSICELADTIASGAMAEPSDHSKLTFAI